MRDFGSRSRINGRNSKEKGYSCDEPWRTYDIRYSFLYKLLAESCKWADEVVPNMPYDPTIELLDQLNCSHVAHGDDIIFKEDGSNVYSEFMDVGRFLMFKRTEGISSTDIVGRLLLMTKNQTDKP